MLMPPFDMFSSQEKAYAFVLHWGKERGFRLIVRRSSKNYLQRCTLTIACNRVY